MAEPMVISMVPSSRPRLNEAGPVLIPAAHASQVSVRVALLQGRGTFGDSRFTEFDLTSSEDGWFLFDKEALALPDGDYEYEFVLDGDEENPVADPYAREITRFGGYRGIFRVRDGAFWEPPFSWAGELNSSHPLKNNNELIIYELPMRWTSLESDIQERQVGLGTFDSALFAHLPNIVRAGFNAIELLPVQDSPDTLNWGYGTRFFFAPDFDMGGPIELKAFIKRCHQSGVRVILDVVMNHAKSCPLETLAREWYFLGSPSEEGREFDWGGKAFRFAQPAPEDRFLAREFLEDMARFWISEYRIDGYRLDEFKGIQNYDFVQGFTDAAWTSHQSLFPGRPFIVIAEDSARRAAVTRATHRGRRVVDAIWDFNQRDELRRTLSNTIATEWGQPARRERVANMISGGASWNDWNRAFNEGFADMANRIIYTTSHDVEKLGEQRMLNYLLREELRGRGWTDVGFQNIQRVVDGYPDYSGETARAALDAAFERARGAFCLLLTSPGIPMTLAGEEFGDTHDTDHEDWRQKMSDVVNWDRRGRPRHRQLEQQFAELASLRTSHPALLRNEIEFFYFHPSFDDPEGERVFAYSRTGGGLPFTSGQVVVIANMSPRNYPEFIFEWRWPQAQEIAVSSGGAPAAFSFQLANIPLLPGQVRVFAT